MKIHPQFVLFCSSVYFLCLIHRLPPFLFSFGFRHHRRRDAMAAFKNNCALLHVISLISLFLSLTFAHDLPSPATAPIVSKVEGPSPGRGLRSPATAPTVSEVEGPSTRHGHPSPATAPTVSEVEGSSLSELASLPAPVSYISSSPDASPASAPSPQPSASSSSAEVGEIYGILETSVTARTDVPAIGKDIQAQVSKVVQSSVIAVKFKTDQFMKNVIAKRLRDPETQYETRDCLNQCKENYDDANDDISKVMEDLSTGDYYKAMVDVEGISTFIDTCYDCLHDMVGDEPEFKKFDDWVKGVTGDCLEELDKINS